MKNINICVYFVDKDNNKVDINDTMIKKRYINIIKQYIKYIDAKIINKKGEFL